jgi:hypothetical protein
LLAEAVALEVQVVVVALEDFYRVQRWLKLGPAKR